MPTGQFPLYDSINTAWALGPPGNNMLIGSNTFYNGPGYQVSALAPTSIINDPNALGGLWFGAARESSQSRRKSRKISRRKSRKSRRVSRRKSGRKSRK
jgi:hypothetical protein